MIGREKKGLVHVMLEKIDPTKRTSHTSAGEREVKKVSRKTLFI